MPTRVESTVMISFSYARKILGPRYILTDEELGELIVVFSELGRLLIDTHTENLLLNKEEQCNF
jgi:hypothetical protein